MCYYGLPPTLCVFVLVYFVCGIYLGKNLDRFDSVEGVEVCQVPVLQGSQFLYILCTVDGGVFFGLSLGP